MTQDDTSSLPKIKQNPDYHMAASEEIAGPENRGEFGFDKPPKARKPARITSR